MIEIRKPAVAGMFYPASAGELKTTVETLLANNKPEKTFENIFGIISPHAGYLYSGRTAAFAYNTIRNKNFNKVIVLSPSHREYFAGISVFNGDAYSTPLGEIPVAIELRDRVILDSPVINISESGHGQEHALEVQLPFLQTVLENFSLLPIVIGDQNRKYTYALAETLAKVTDDQTLIVASTDLSHFYSREDANIMDSIIEEKIIDFDYEELQTELELKNCEACGGGCVVALMKAAEIKGKNKSFVLSHTDSGDVTGDLHEVVGYLSAVIYG